MVNASYEYFLGVDVSKRELVFNLKKGSQTIAYGKWINELENVNQAMEKLMKDHGIEERGSLLVCMEATGEYGLILANTCDRLGINLWIENALSIKRSGGLQRGKDDSIDAHRIAEYASRYCDKARIFKASRAIIVKLQALYTLRERLVNNLHSLSVPLKDIEHYQGHEIGSKIKTHSQRSIEALNQDIKEVEQEIKKLIDSDDHLKMLNELITSIPGIGNVTAATIIIKTNEFRLFDNAKQLACYCGIAPFAHTSGTSIRGRTRVSPFADKQLKKLFHLCAVTAITHNDELRVFFERKVSEGKHKMSVINAVRNKLVHRVWAVVHRGTTYQAFYQPNLDLT